MIQENNNQLNIIKIISHTLIFILFIGCTSYAFSLTNFLGIYFLYFSPLSLLLFVFLKFIEIKTQQIEKEEKRKEAIKKEENKKEENKKEDRNATCNCTYPLLCIGLVILLPIFSGIFFGVFHPLFSLEFKQIQNCNVIGIAPMNHGNQYSILYVDFEYESQTLLGQACLSDDYNYSFPKNDVSFECGKENPDYDIEKEYRQLEENNKENRFLSEPKDRLLKKTGPCKSRPKRQSKYRSYWFSEYKIPYYLCGRQNISYEEMIKTKTCYVHFYGDAQQSYQNSKDRLNQLEIRNAAIITFDYPNYNKTGYFCLIIFTYIPSISFIHFFLSLFIINKIFTLVDYAKSKL